MTLAILILAGAFLLPALYLILQNNTPVTPRGHIRDAGGDIDTKLKRRYDLIPNLVAMVKEYAKNEQEVLERVTWLRIRCEANRGLPHEQTIEEAKLVASSSGFPPEEYSQVEPLSTSVPAANG